MRIIVSALHINLSSLITFNLDILAFTSELKTKNNRKVKNKLDLSKLL